MTDSEQTDIVFVGGEKVRADGPPSVVAGNLSTSGPGGFAEVRSHGESLLVNRDAVAYLRPAASGKLHTF